MTLQQAIDLAKHLAWDHGDTRTLTYFPGYSFLSGDYGYDVIGPTALLVECESLTNITVTEGE